MDAISSLIQFSKLRFYQGRLIELTKKYNITQANLISIQATLTPPLKVMLTHLKNAKELLKQDPNSIFANNLVDLVERMEIRIQALESIRTNWVVH